MTSDAKSVRSIYDKLPANTRIRVRSVIPKSVLRWHAHKNTDVYLISYPKCGRTWLRLMLGRAISRHFSLPEEEDTLFLRGRKKLHPEVPRIAVIHEDRPMLKAPDELETSKDRYSDKKVIFLARDPRDVIISSYFEMIKRGHIFGDNPHETRKPIFNGSLQDFINKREGGFDTILAYYNIWAKNRHVPMGFLLVRYEDIKANPQIELRKTLNFLDLQAISDATIAEAVQFASFENMRKMEVNGKFQTGILNPADKADRDSYKTRKGKIKGYVDYLDEKEIESLNHKIKNILSDFYGYAP